MSDLTFENEYRVDWDSRSNLPTGTVQFPQDSNRDNPLVEERLQKVIVREVPSTCLRELGSDEWCKPCTCGGSNGLKSWSIV